MTLGLHTVFKSFLFLTTSSPFFLFLSYPPRQPQATSSSGNPPFSGTPKLLCLVEKTTTFTHKRKQGCLEWHGNSGQGGLLWWLQHHHARKFGFLFLVLSSFPWSFCKPASFRKALQRVGAKPSRQYTSIAQANALAHAL